MEAEEGYWLPLLPSLVLHLLSSLLTYPGRRAVAATSPLLAHLHTGVEEHRASAFIHQYNHSYFLTVPVHEPIHTVTVTLALEHSWGRPTTHLQLELLRDHRTVAACQPGQGAWPGGRRGRWCLEEEEEVVREARVGDTLLLFTGRGIVGSSLGLTLHYQLHPQLDTSYM